MSYAGRLLCFVLLSSGVHLMLARGMQHGPARPRARPAQPVVVEVQLREPALSLRERAAAPEPAAVSVREVHLPRRPRLRPISTDRPTGPKHPTPVPTERSAASGEPSASPVFGISMESTSRGGTGPIVPVGNTTQLPPDSTRSAAPVKPLATPVGAHQVTKLPLPRGRCSGRYTEEARQAGLEGTVVLDLIVGEDGRVREVTLVKGLGGGLSAAAIAALQGCRFSPGEREGRAVPVRLRGFKIRFVLQGGD